MKKTVHTYTHTGLTTALFATGWLSFLAGQLVECPLVSIPLLAITKDLP